MHMSEVSFNEDPGFAAYQPRAAQARTGFAGLLIKWGFAKDEKQADLILIGIALVAFAITIYLIVFGHVRSAIVPPPQSFSADS